MDRFLILEETKDNLQKNKIELELKLKEFITEKKNQKIGMLPDYYDEENEFTTKHHTLFVYVKSRPASSQLPDAGYIALQVADGYITGRADTIIDLIDEINYLTTKLYELTCSYKENVCYYR